MTAYLGAGQRSVWAPPPAEEEEDEEEGEEDVEHDDEGEHAVRDEGQPALLVAGRGGLAGVQGGLHLRLGRAVVPLLVPAGGGGQHEGEGGEDQGHGADSGHLDTPQPRVMAQCYCVQPPQQLGPE